MEVELRGQTTTEKIGHAYASIKTEYIRKLNTGKFNFQWTKTLYKNILSHITFFFTLFKTYIKLCNKLYKISPTKRFLWEPRRINFRFHFVKFEAFEVCFPGLR